MDGKMRIIVADKEESFYSEVYNTIVKSASADCEVKYVKGVNISEIQGMDCIIVDSRLVDDIRQFMSQMSKAGVKKVIFITDSLNHPMSNAVIASGGTVFYRYSPVTALLHSIFGAFKPYKNQERDAASTYDQSAPRIAAVHSPAGGTGKSTICINLAMNFVHKNLKVLVVDFSQYGCMGVKLRIRNRGTGLSSILAALEQNRENMHEINLDQVISDNIFRYKNEAINIDVIISANPIKMEKTTADDIERIFMSLRETDYDIILVDTSCELSQKNLAILQMADEILLVSTPDVCCGWSLLQFKEIAANLGISEKCRLIVNMYSRYAGFSCRELESELQYPLISVVPVYRELLLLNNQGISPGLKKKHQINAFVGRISEYILPCKTGKKNVKK